MRKRELGDYRPISILSSVSKALEKVMKCQITDHLNEFEPLCDRQSAFRPNPSTVTALLDVTEEIRRNMDKNLATVLLLLDFSKAFDSVPHDLLLRKLETNFDFTAPAVRLIESYLGDSFQSVCVNGCFSDFLPLRRGVPQGSVLGPLLFSMFINDLPEVLKFCKSHLFADDFQMSKVVHPDQISLHSQMISDDIRSVLQWSASNGFLINAVKTKAIVIGGERWSGEIPKFEIDGVSIDFVHDVKNLGLLIDKSLSWEQQARAVSSKIFAGLRYLWPHASYLTMRVKKLLVRSLLLPHFVYCCQVLGKISAAVRDILLKPFKACVRFAHGLGRFESTSRFESSLLGNDLFAYMDYLNCVFLHKLIITKEPLYLHDKMTFSKSARTLNVAVPRSNRTVLGKSVFVHGVSVYNSLPHGIKHKFSSTGFKSACVRDTFV